MGLMETPPYYGPVKRKTPLLNQSSKTKYLITNVVYGDLYSKIFTEQHLKSVLDETNLPAIVDRYEVEYRIFTDAETREKLEQHPNMKRLANLLSINQKESRLKFTLFEWNKDDPKFQLRYSVLMQAFQFSVDYACKNKMLLTAWVADLVVARNFFPKILSRIEAGHDAVFVLPLRSAFEPMGPLLNQANRALDPMELFAMGFLNLHPLWVACEWANKRFTKLPFSILWSKPSGILARSFSITPIVFIPTMEMLQGRGMIDGDVPAKCKNPYWCEDWTDAPVIGVEPLFCYYPPFMPEPAPIKGTRTWARKALDPTQRPFLKKRLYYPDKKTARIGWWTRMKSDFITRLIR